MAACNKPIGALVLCFFLCQVAVAQEENPLELSKQAEEAVRNGDCEEAQIFYRKILTIIPGDPKAQDGLEYCGDILQAKRKEEAAEKARNSVPYFIDTFLEALDGGEYESAVEYMTKVLEVGTENVDFSPLVVRLLEIGDYSLAKTALETIKGHEGAQDAYNNYRDELIASSIANGEEDRIKEACSPLVDMVDFDGAFSSALKMILWSSYERWRDRDACRALGSLMLFPDPEDWKQARENLWRFSLSYRRSSVRPSDPYDIQVGSFYQLLGCNPKKPKRFHACDTLTNIPDHMMVVDFQTGLLYVFNQAALTSCFENTGKPGFSGDDLSLLVLHPDSGSAITGGPEVWMTPGDYFKGLKTHVPLLISMKTPIRAREIRHDEMNDYYSLAFREIPHFSNNYWEVWSVCCDDPQGIPATIGSAGWNVRRLMTEKDKWP